MIPGDLSNEKIAERIGFGDGFELGTSCTRKIKKEIAKEKSKKLVVVTLALSVYQALIHEEDAAAIALIEEAFAKVRDEATTRALDWFDSPHRYCGSDPHGEAREALRKAIEGSWAD